MNSTIEHPVLILLMTLVSMLSFGQELTVQMVNDIKYGRIENLEKLSSKSITNDCLGVKDSKKYNYLAISIKLKSLKSLKFFIEKGADIEGACAEKTPLMYAAKYGQLEMFKYLVEQGADIDASLRGNRALTYARRFHQTEIIKYIKDQKVR